MEIRNPAYNALGTIDCEWNHPVLGWIDFTAAADDPEAHGRAIHAAALAMGPAEYVEPGPSASDVAAERDRRLAADFTFQGKMYQRDPKSLQRIAGAAQMASLALASGAQADDLRWHGGDSDFGWIASDDTVTPMTAPTMIAFGQAAAAMETQIIFAARNLRRMDPIPADFTEDTWWP